VNEAHRIKCCIWCYIALPFMDSECQFDSTGVDNTKLLSYGRILSYWFAEKLVLFVVVKSVNI
jgi:hypothetical protein